MPGGQHSTGLLLVNGRRVEVVAADDGRSLEDRRVRPETGLFGIQERATLLGAGGGRQRQVSLCRRPALEPRLYESVVMALSVDSASRGTYSSVRRARGQRPVERGLSRVSDASQATACAASS